MPAGYLLLLYWKRKSLYTEVADGAEKLPTVRLDKAYETMHNCARACVLVCF